MSRHICTKEVPNRCFTVGKIYSEVGSSSLLTFLVRDDKDDLVVLFRFISNYNYYILYKDYFEDATSAIRDQKISEII
jgi:hypothetical protein